MTQTVATEIRLPSAIISAITVFVALIEAGATGAEALESVEAHYKANGNPLAADAIRAAIRLLSWDGGSKYIPLDTDSIHRVFGENMDLLMDYAYGLQQEIVKARGIEGQLNLDLAAVGLE